MHFSLITKRGKFAAFFWTQFLGAFNDNVFKNALVLLVAFRGVQIANFTTEQIVALAGGIFILPFFLFSPLAGQLCDKFEKSYVIRLTKIAEILIMLAAAVGFLTHSYVLLLAVLFLMGAQSAFFGPAKYSMIPELVHEDQLTEGNAFIELGTFISILLGTIAGGSLTKLEAADTVIGVSLVFVAAVGYLSARKIPAATRAAPDLKIQWNPLPEMKDLWNIARQKEAVFNSLLGISWFWFFGAAILSILPIYVKDYLKADEAVVTLFLAMFTLGIGLGSIVCERLSFKRVEIGIVPIGSLGMTIFLLDLFFSGHASTATQQLSLEQFIHQPGAIRVVVDFFMMSVFGGVYIVPLYTLLQERSSADTRSRVIAANNILNAFFMVISSFTVLFLYSLKLDQAHLFAVFAVLNTLVAVYIYSIVPEFTLRFYSWILSRLMYRVTVEGLEHIPKEGACVLAGNHVTYVDWLILAGACPRPARFVMHYSFFQMPLLKLIFKQAKVIPIAGAKEDEALLNQAFEKINAELTQDEVVCIFPEGRLTSDGKVAPLRPGLKQIIDRHPCPVVPVVLEGLWGSIFSRHPHKDKPYRRQIRVRFLPAVQPDRLTLAGLEALFKRELRE